MQGFSITVASGRGTVNAVCPAGKKVLGCSYKPPNFFPDYWHQNAPSDDGSMCICINKYGIS
jgi:hypothetical protein